MQSQYDPRMVLIRLIECISGFVEAFPGFLGVLADPASRSEEGMAVSMSKGLMDPGLLYAKLMVMCVQFWLAPDQVRRDGLRPSPNAERSFDLLWLAYEQWYSRGFNHYAQVAAELEDFYKRLRWVLASNRNNSNFIRNLDNIVADASQGYLKRVVELAQENFEAYEAAMNQILKKLKTLNEEIKETTQPEMPEEPLLADEDEKETETTTTRRDRGTTP
jgi:hypothetical protein